MILPVPQLSVPLVLSALSVAMLLLGGYAAGGGYFPFVFGLRRVRIAAGPSFVRLTGIDAPAMFNSGYVVWALPGLLLIFGTTAAIAGGAVVLVLWFGFRLTVEVTPTQTRVVRTAAFIIPWSTRRHAEPARANVDGWGDFMAPEALVLDFADEKHRLELGWADRTSGKRCENLAAEFNAAVAALAK